MGAIEIVAIVILMILSVVFIVLTFVTTRNTQNLAKSQTFGSFSAVIDPTTGIPGTFSGTNASGESVPQITCPAGTVVNIVGAFYDVIDPYNECSTDITQVNPQMAFLCDPTATGTTVCKSDNDCPLFNATAGNSNPFQCLKAGGASTGFCALRDIGAQGQCPAGQNPSLKKYNLGTTSQPKYYCLNTDMCGLNINPRLANGLGVPNPICGSTGVSQCAIRDASASVALKCDGRQECGDLSYVDFGDTPCVGLDPKKCISSYSGTDPQWAGPRKGYCALPFIPGQPQGTGDDTNPASGNIGYSMHGIYTCVPA